MRQLYKVKVRVYNQEFPNKPTPSGQFQGWFSVDAPLTDTGEPDLEYWLAKKEVRASMRDMYVEFNAPYVWEPDESKITYYVESDNVVVKGQEDIPFSDEPIKSQPKYGVKTIPHDLLGKITISDLVVGLSTIAPIAEIEPQGATKDHLMVLKENEINWDSGDLHILVYSVTDADRARWREEN